MKTSIYSGALLSLNIVIRLDRYICWQVSPSCVPHLLSFGDLVASRRQYTHSHCTKHSNFMDFVADSWSLPLAICDAWKDCVCPRFLACWELPSPVQILPPSWDLSQALQAQILSPSFLLPLHFESLTITTCNSFSLDLELLVNMWLCLTIL